MYAVDDLSDAIDTTREFLTPVRVGTWLKLAIVVLFVGGAGVGGPPFPGGDSGSVTDEPGADQALETAIPSEDVVLAVIALAVVVGILWLLWSAIAAVMEFVFIESLRREEVHVRRYAKRNLGRAAHLFLFRLLLGVGLLVLVGGPALLAVGLGVGTGLAELTALSLLLFGALAVGLYLVYAIVGRFTTVFVTAVMLRDERGILDAWKRFWPAMKGEWKEYAVYLVLIWIIQLAVGIAYTLVAVIGGLVIAIPFVVVAAVLGVFGGDIGIVIAVAVGLVGLLAILAFAFLLRVPIESYFRYYALLVLGDTDADLDLIPEQRARVRSDGGRPDDADPRRGRDEPGAGTGRTDEPDGWSDHDGSREGADRRNDDSWDDDGWRDEADDRDDSSDWDGGRR